MSKYWSNVGQNYLFGDILSNHGNVERKLVQYLYLYGMHQKMQTLFQIWLKHALYTINNMNCVLSDNVKSVIWLRTGASVRIYGCVQYQKGWLDAGIFCF